MTLKPIPTVTPATNAVVEITSEARAKTPRSPDLEEPDAKRNSPLGSLPLAASSASAGALGVTGAMIHAAFDATKVDLTAQNDRVQADVKHSIRGDYAKGLKLMSAYFPGGDFNAEPNVIGYDDTWHVLNEVGVCNVGLGRLEQAIEPYARARSASLTAGDLGGQRSIAANLAEVYGWLGRFGDMRKEASEFLKLAAQTKDERQTKEARVVLAYAQLRDDSTHPQTAFATLSGAEQSKGGLGDLRDLWGIWATDVLIAADRLDDAEPLARSVLEDAIANETGPVIVQAHRVLGDIARSRNDRATADEHYGRALEVGRTIGGPVYDELLQRTRL